VTLSPLVLRLAERWFGHRIVRNDIRGELVEEIVGMALEPEWVLCGGDWAACDLKRRRDGLRIQVKQSAALQSWTAPGNRKPKPCYSIAQKTGRWEDSKWIQEPGRNADLFVFGWHGRTDEAADHRDPEQWQFFVVPERNLPDQKTISLANLERSANIVGYRDLRNEVQKVVTTIDSSRHLESGPPD
jgi:hypothetical protein